VKFGSGWYWLKIVPLTIAIMSGALSIIREAYGMFAAKPIDPRSIFWECARIAFMLSAGIVWWQQRQIIQRLENAGRDALARKRPGDEYKELQVHKWLECYTPEGRNFLRWLLHHGAAFVSEFGRSGVDDGASGAALNEGLKTGLVLYSPRGTGTAYRINENYTGALAAALHPDPGTPQNPAQASQRD
jgi:hypothetical protein